MCKDALHLGHAFRHCLTIGLPQVGRVYARGNRFAASARTRRAPGRRDGAGEASAHGSSRIPHDSVRPGMLDGPGGQVLLAGASSEHASAHSSAEHAPLHGTCTISGETVRGGMLRAGGQKTAQDENYLLALERITSAATTTQVKMTAPAATGGTGESSMTRCPDSLAPPEGRAVRSRASKKPSGSAGPSSTVSTAKK